MSGDALSWRAKISAQVELEQPETAQKRHFLAFSDVLQNGVREMCMNLQIVAAALRGDVGKSIAIWNEVVGDERKTKTKGLLVELNIKLSKKSNI